MAFNNLTSISIGDGDPVTADVLRKIVENINIIAKGETVTPVQIESKTINGGTSIVSKNQNTTVGGIITGKSLTPTMKSFPVNLKSYGFTETPSISLTIEFPSTSQNAAYTPYIINATKDGFNIWCKSATTTTKSLTNAKIHWTASGNTSSLTE
ncbi:MAG: hypothetical protein EB127_01165 [Alphaproteobacteria bacterium]|nr:hypothetical protein [Alphaproteobacteria bacterium]